MELPPENRRAKAKVKDMVERFEKQFSSDGK